MKYLTRNNINIISCKIKYSFQYLYKAVEFLNRLEEELVFFLPFFI